MPSSKFNNHPYPTTPAKMFAVPGWSVSSSALKTQVAPSSKPTANAQAPDQDVEANAKKRKRSGGKSAKKDVNPNNLADRWESVIEGKPKKKKSKKEHREKTQETPHDEPSGKAEAGEDAAPQELNTEEKPKKSKKDKKREKKAKDPSMTGDTKADPPKEVSATTAQVQAPKPAPAPTATKLTPLQASMRQKLISARFRQLNQTLYTTPSEQSLSLFAENPEMFNEYHEGFRRQVEVWPENPVDGYIINIKVRGKIRGPQRGKHNKKSAESETEGGEVLPPLPRTEGTCNIADLGCGDAALSTSLQPMVKKLKLKIHSFDLQSPSPLVTKADIANLPLPDSSIDIAIFCLALMGTNWIDFIEEAFRILRWKGELWISEIKSRFGRVEKGKKVVEHSVGNRKRRPESKEAKKASKRAEEQFDDDLAAVEIDGLEKGEETDVSAFVEVLRKRGFVLKGDGQGGDNGVDLRNKMFVKMCFVKGATPIKGKCVLLPKGIKEVTGQTWKKKPKGKFIDDEDKGENVQSEAGVLKPCVYKLR